MYKTCLFCKKPLGENEVVEHFPVGRRLAFDAAKGRLWVVCRKCRRWNLTPLEERWEAIEECERFYRDTRIRTSTENIGIARLRGGLELVRIGKPLRPEFAAWRYGDRMGERMRRQIAASAVGFPAGVATYQVLTPLLGLTLVPVVVATLFWLQRRQVAKVRVGDAPEGAAAAPDNIARFRGDELSTFRILPDNRDPGFRVEIRQGDRTAWFQGADARRVAAAIVPLLNQWGAGRGTVRAAVGEIESCSHPGQFLAEVASQERTDRRARSGFVRYMPKPTRLALEMALHEEQERRALEGELWALEQAWKEAEEIAAISDSLLLPAATDEFFKRFGREARGREGGTEGDQPVR